MSYKPQHILNSMNCTQDWLLDVRQTKTFEEFQKALKRCLEDGGKILTFGNGGSATEASHFVGEIVGKCKDDNGAWPAISLNDSPALLTCISNDWDFDYVFQRQLEALLAPIDFVIGFTTSGSSKNVINALNYSNQRGATTSLWTSKKCPPMNLVGQYNIIAPTLETTLTQELHLLLIHVASLYLEENIKK